MTRETKVGLLAGMALILLIGILVSDHLSVGQKESAGTKLIEFAPVAGNGLTGTPASTPGTVAPADGRTDVQPAQGGVGTLRLPGQIPTIPTLEQPGADRDGQRIAMGTGTFGQPGGVQSGRGNSTSLFDPPTQGAVQSPGTITIAPPNYGSALANNEVRPITNEVTVVGPATGIGGGGTELTVIAPAQAEKPTRYHTVNEPLIKVAEQYYHDGNKWTVIQQANKDKVGPNGQVRAGVRLVIPYIDEPAATPKSVTGGSNMAALTDGSASATDDTNNPEPAPVSANAVPPRTVRVENGQTLSDIAHRHMGSSARWPELLTANRDQIRRPEELKAGMVLKLPNATQTSADNATANRGTAIAAAPKRLTSAAGGKKYTVASGDTLSSIARSQMGNEGAWYKLFEANRDKLRTADDLTVGEQLTIPGK